MSPWQRSNSIWRQLCSVSGSSKGRGYYSLAFDRAERSHGNPRSWYIPIQPFCCCSQRQYFLCLLDSFVALHNPTAQMKTSMWYQTEDYPYLNYIGARTSQGTESRPIPKHATRLVLGFPEEIIISFQARFGWPRPSYTAQPSLDKVEFSPGASPQFQLDILLAIRWLVTSPLFTLNFKSSKGKVVYESFSWEQTSEWPPPL